MSGLLKPWGQRGRWRGDIFSSEKSAFWSAFPVSLGILVRERVGVRCFKLSLEVVSTWRISQTRGTQSPSLCDCEPAPCQGNGLSWGGSAALLRWCGAGLRGVGEGTAVAERGAGADRPGGLSAAPAQVRALQTRGGVPAACRLQAVFTAPPRRPSQGLKAHLQTDDRRGECPLQGHTASVGQSGHSSREPSRSKPILASPAAIHRSTCACGDPSFRLTWPVQGGWGAGREPGACALGHVLATALISCVPQIALLRWASISSSVGWGFKQGGVAGAGRCSGGRGRSEAVLV